MCDNIFPAVVLQSVSESRPYPRLTHGKPGADLKQKSKGLCVMAEDWLESAVAYIYELNVNKMADSEWSHV